MPHNSHKTVCASDIGRDLMRKLCGIMFLTEFGKVTLPAVLMSLKCAVMLNVHVFRIKLKCSLNILTAFGEITSPAVFKL